MASDLSGMSEASKSSGATGLSADTEPTPLARPGDWREAGAILFWTLFADLLIFRSAGFSGPGVFLAIVPILFWVASPTVLRRRWGWVAVALLLAVSMRLIWSGSSLLVFSGATLLVALSMIAAGTPPFVLEGIIFAGRVTLDGLTRLSAYRFPVRASGRPWLPGTIAAWAFPIGAAVVFAVIFVLANPDLVDSVSAQIQHLTERLKTWIQGTSLWELPFCVLATLVGAGLLRPVLPMRRVGPSENQSVGQPVVSETATLYSAFRNTLITLIVMFAIYLAFEFTTLWRRDFPDGFYYAGYAHQGAAWLTFALALATALLSVVFSGAMLRDERVARMRWLAWIWSAQNLLLAAAVYNRLMIYIGYNGMTRMRMVGLFGITLVVVGFLLVLVKIAKRRRFWWLLRAQLIALVMTVILYSLTPVDYLAHRYNVAQVASGYLHPSVMIAVKTIDDEGIMPLMELVDAEDDVIRQGVLAKLAERQIQLEAERQPAHWTEYQICQGLLLGRLQQRQAEWQEFLDSDRKRNAALDDFEAYAMQWY